MARTLEQLVAEEIPRCEAFLTKYPGIKTPPRMPLKTFVERCAKMHRQLLMMWDSWDFHGPFAYVEDPSGSEPRAKDALHKFTAECIKLRDAGPFDEAGFALTVPRGWTTYFAAGNSCDGIVIHNHDVLISKTLLTDYHGYKVDRPGAGADSAWISPGYYTEYETRTGRDKQKTVKTKIRKGQRIIPALMAALDTMKCQEKWPELYALHEKFFAFLGEAVWQSQKVPSAVTLTARPSAFLQLGHYNGIDQGSCYRNGSLHDSSKLFLAADLPDSFVLLTYRGVDEPKLLKLQQEMQPMGRGWGIGVPRRGAVVSNFYSLTKDVIYEAILEAVAKGLDVPNPEAFGAKVIAIRDHENSAFYTNADCTYLAGKTAFRQKYTDHYLREVINYADKLGLYTRNGAGPRRPLPDLKLPKVWPYPEIDNVAAVKAGGLFV